MWSTPSRSSTRATPNTALAFFSHPSQAKRYGIASLSRRAARVLFPSASPPTYPRPLLGIRGWNPLARFSFCIPLFPLPSLPAYHPSPSPTTKPLTSPYYTTPHHTTPHHTALFSTKPHPSLPRSARAPTHRKKPQIITMTMAVQPTWSSSTLCSAKSRAALISASSSTSTLVGHTLGLGHAHFLKELNSRNNPIFNVRNAQLRIQTIQLAQQATTPVHLPRWAIEKCKKHRAPEPYRPHHVEAVDRRPDFELERLIVQLQSMRTSKPSLKTRFRRAVAGHAAAIAAALKPGPRPKPKCNIPSTCHVIAPALVVTPPPEDADPEVDDYVPAFVNKSFATIHLSMVDSDCCTSTRPCRSEFVRRLTPSPLPPLC